MSQYLSPTTWVKSSLGEIGAWGSGGTPKRTNPLYYGGSIPWLVIGDLNDSVVTTSKNTITEAGLQNSSAKIVDKGTLLIAMYGSIGKLGITGMECSTNQAIATCAVNPAFADLKFVFFYLLSQRAQLLLTGKGGAQQNISQTVLKAYELPIPPLAEQKVIADKLDTLLAQVENTKARLERIPQILKRFRQSVLAAAVSGRLTDIPEEEFQTIPIEQLAKQQRYSLGIGPFGSNLKVSDYREAGHPLVFVREIRANQFGDGATKFVSGDKFDELKAHRVAPGDILITKMGDPPGDVAVYPLDQPEAVITADCIKLSVEESIYCRDYIALAMQAEQFRRAVFSISAGVAQQKVNLTKFRKLSLRVPAIAEQTEIVRRVDQLFAHADRIEHQVNNALTRVNNLTQSILAKAFRGELTEQWRKDNPELISGENSAEALLERIKAEKAASKPAKKARKQTTA